MQPESPEEYTGSVDGETVALAPSASEVFIASIRNCSFLSATARVEAAGGFDALRAACATEATSSLAPPEFAIPPGQSLLSAFQRTMMSRFALHSSLVVLKLDEPALADMDDAQPGASPWTVRRRTVDERHTPQMLARTSRKGATTIRTAARHPGRCKALRSKFNSR